MKDIEKTKEELIDELQDLRKKCESLQKERFEEISCENENETCHGNICVKYRLFAEEMKDVPWILDPETFYFIYVSPTVKDLRGYSADEVMALSVTHALSDEERDYVRENMNQRIKRFRENKEDEFQKDFIKQPCKDGSYVWTEVITRLFENSETGKIEVYGVSRDVTDRKKIEEELKESKARYKALFEASPDAVLLADRSTGIIIDANQTAEKLFETSLDNIIGKHQSQLHPEPQHQKAKNTFKNKPTNENQLATPVEIDIVTAQNTIKSVEIRGKIIDLKGKELVLGTFRDITERKRAEEALLNSRQRLEFAMQGSRMGVWDWNIQTDEVVFSDLWAKMLEYSSEEVEPTVDFFKHHIHPDDQADVLDRLMGHIEGRYAMYESEHRLRTKSGKWLWIQDRGKITEYDNDSRPVRASGIIQDITDRKQAEQALKESEEKYKALFDFLPFGVSLTDKKGNLVENNEEAERLLGLSEEELLKRQISGEVWNIIRLDGSLMPAEEYASVKALKENRRVENVIMGIVKENNETTWITVTAEPFKHGDYGVVISYLDITKMVLAEKELKQNEERLNTIVNIFQSKTESIEEFLDYALNKAVEFSDSKLGFINLYNEEKREFTLNSHSKQAMEECSINDKPTRYDLDEIGIWGETVRRRKPLIINDYQAANPMKKGYPEGHALIKNFMAVPIFIRDEIVSVVGVANKATDYNESDVLQLILLIDTVWRAVERKQESEIQAELFEEIQAAKENLEALLFQKNSLLEELTESEAKLKETLAAKDKFFSIMAHDLKSPFSGFIGLTEIISKEAEELSVKEIKFLSETINESANSIFDLLNDLLMWSRTQTDSMPFNTEELDLYEIAFNPTCGPYC